MPRSKAGTNLRRRHNKVLKLTKGHSGSRHTLWRTANESMLHSLRYAYRGRRERKRDFRKLWITRINAAARLNGITYSRFMAGLKKSGVTLDRKVLADLAIRDAGAFAQLAETAKNA